MTTWKESSHKKIVLPETLEKIADTLHQQKKTIATINGSFDLLHAGHLHILFEAAKQGDVLFVLANSDQSVQGYKSSNRPLIPLPYRLQMLAAISFIDYVTWFDEIDPRLMLEKIKPTVHVNGSEYGPNCIEANVVKENGGKVHIVNRIDGLSTTEIIQKIRQCV